MERIVFVLAIFALALGAGTCNMKQDLNKIV